MDLLYPPKIDYSLIHSIAFEKKVVTLKKLISFAFRITYS